MEADGGERDDWFHNGGLNVRRKRADGTCSRGGSGCVARVLRGSKRGRDSLGTTREYEVDAFGWSVRDDNGELWSAEEEGCGGMLGLGCP